MRKMMTAAVAAFALVSSTSAFAQQTYHPIGNFGNSAPGGTPYLAINGFTTDGLHSLPDDTTPATTTVTNSFTLTGTVNKDCSYYSGAVGNTPISIPLGTIGVRNGNNEAVNNLFNQNGGFTVQIQSTSAGCNTENTVTVSHSPNGLVNLTPGSYDNTQFTAKIPYTIVTGITSATPLGSTAAGSFQTFSVAPNTGSSSADYGAWRSLIDVEARIPAQTLGLVAGTYSDTIVVTLAAH